MGFRSTIILLFTTLLIVTVSIVTFNSYDRAREGILDLSDHVIDGAVTKIVLRITEMVKLAESSLSLLSTALQDKDILAAQEETLPLLWVISRQSAFYHSAYIADNKGNFIQARKHPNPATRVNYFSHTDKKEVWVYRDEHYQPLAHVEKPLEYDPLTRPWYQQTQTDKRIYWSDIYVWAQTGEPGVTVSYPLLDKAGQLAGVLGIDIGLTSLNRFVTEERLGQDSVLLIIDSADQIIAHSLSWTAVKETTPTQSLLTVAELGQHYRYIEQAWNTVKTSADLQSKTNPVSTLKLAGKHYFIKKVQITEQFKQNWYLFLIVPDYEVMDTVDRGLYTSVTLSLIMLIVAIYITFVIANRLTIPLKQVVENAHLLEQFRFSELKPVKMVFEEFRLLDASMQKMKSSLVTFQHYVPTTVACQLLRNHQQEVKLGAESRPLVLLSCAINNFSRLTRQIAIQDTVTYLSHYQIKITHILQHNDSTLDKFIGDRVIAFWGAPVATKNDAYHGCCGALDSLKAIMELNRDLRGQNLPPMQVRIALHADDCIVGNFGSEDQMFYSVLGDGVELVRWLENLNKQYGTTIIVSDAVYQRVSRDFNFRWLDRLTCPIEDKSELNIYELVLPSSDNDGQRQEYISRYEAALHVRYDDGNYVAALEQFRQIQSLYPEDRAIASQIEALTERVKKGAV